MFGKGYFGKNYFKGNYFGPVTVVTVVTQATTPDASGAVSLQQIYLQEPEDLNRKILLKEDEEILMIIVATMNSGIINH